MKTILIISRDTVFARGTQIILENGGFGAYILPTLPADFSQYDALITDIPINKDKLSCPVIFSDYESSDCEFFLSRPFSDKELLDICNLACTGNAIEVPDKFTLDTKRKRVSFGKSTVSLTDCEFALLSLLMNIPCKTVSREEIISSVFGGTATGNADAVYVNYLRKKLTAISGKNPIIRVRGVGYQFRE